MDTQPLAPVTTGRDRLLVAAVLALAALGFVATSQPVAPIAFMVGAVGVFATHESLRREHSTSAATLTSIAVVAGSPLAWAMSRDTEGVEVMAFALCALAVSALSHARRGWRRVLLWAVLAGIPLARAVTLDAFDSSVERLAWLERLYGSPFGFLSTSPLAWLAVIGTIVMTASRPSRAIALLLLFANWLVWPVPADWSLGPAAHGLTPSLALLAGGVATLIDRARARPFAAALVLAGAAGTWNYWLMVQYASGLLPKDAPVAFSQMVRQQSDAHTQPPYLYPLALPANLLFGWRHGVPADRFEALAFRPSAPDVDLPMDRGALPLLLDGWEPSDGREAAQWIRDRRASMLLPVDMSAGRAVDLLIDARARLEEPPVRATLAVVLNETEIGRIVAPPAAAERFRIRVPFDVVGRVGRPDYNRLTFMSLGIERVDPRDTRPPGPLASRPGDRPWPVAIYRIRVTPH